MNPGGDTVTFVTKGGSSRDSMGNLIVVETSEDVEGCFFQPVSVDDTVSDTQFASATHRCISPPDDAVVAIGPEDRLIFNGVSHRILGKRTFNDWHGRLDHITIVCEEQSS